MDYSDTLLSVVIPVYNTGEYLAACVDSVLSQTYRHLEIILVDDGSTGCEPDMCDRYAASDARVRVIHQANSGSVAAREAGIRAASGTYITFVDSDDWLDSDYYERMMKHMLDDDSDLITVSYTLNDGDDSSVVSQGIDSGIYGGQGLLYLFHNMNCLNSEYYTAGIFPSNCTKVFKTSLLRMDSASLPTGIRMGDDAGLTFPYILRCHRITVDNTIHGYHYRQVRNSISHTADETLLTGASVLYEYLKPYYSAAADSDIMTQLELYRAFLIQYALDRWMKGHALSRPVRCARLRRLTQRTSLTDNLDAIINLNITKPLRDQLTAIRDGRWIRFMYLWNRHYYATGIISRLCSST